MLHSTNKQKNIKKEEIIFDWTGLDETSQVYYRFYPIANLAKDGFIHADGSLRFEFNIKKLNL